MREAAEPRAIAAHGGTGGLDTTKTRDKFADPNAGFHARERHAGARVYAGPEGEVAVRLAPYVEPVGIGKLRWVAVGGADRDMHIGAGLHRHTTEHGVLGRAAIPELIRAFHAQEFFDRGVDEFGMRAQVRECIGVADQQIDAIADEIRRGLVSGVQKKNAIVDEFELAEPLVCRRVRVELASADQRSQDLAGAAAASLCLAADVAA